MIENLVNHYINSCQEIPLRFPPSEEEVETENERVNDGGDIRSDKHLGDEGPLFRGLNGVVQSCENEILNEPELSKDDEERKDVGEKLRGIKGQERKRRNEDDEHGDGEKMGMKKKSTSSSSSSSSSPVTASRALQESRQSVSSSSESINIISVDDDEEEEVQIEERKIKGVKEESEERGEKEGGKILMNDPNDVEMSRCSEETNGGTNHSSHNHHHHILHRMDEDEIDLLNSSNSNSSSSSSSSWSTIYSTSKINTELSDREPRQSKAKILELLFTSIQQLASFCKKINCFNQLAPLDQEILLKGCILEMCFIRSGVCYDPVTNSWPDPSETIKSLLSFRSNPGGNFMAARSSEFSGQMKSGQFGNPNTPVISRHRSSEEGMKREKKVIEGKKTTSLSIFDIRPLMSQDLFTKYTKFIKSIQEMNLDQISVIILCIILLLTPDRIGLGSSSIEFITRQQEKYLLLLQRYMVWKFGHISSSVLFPKLLLKLPDLRELSELLTDYQLVLCKEEVQSVQSKLQQQLIISSPKDDGFQEE